MKAKLLAIGLMGILTLAGSAQAEPFTGKFGVHKDGVSGALEYSNAKFAVNNGSISAAHQAIVDNYEKKEACINQAFNDVKVIISDSNASKLLRQQMGYVFAEQDAPTEFVRQFMNGLLRELSTTDSALAESLKPELIAAIEKPNNFSYHLSGVYDKSNWSETNPIILHLDDEGLMAFFYSNGKELAKTQLRSLDQVDNCSLNSSSLNEFANKLPGALVTSAFEDFLAKFMEQKEAEKLAASQNTIVSGAEQVVAATTEEQITASGLKDYSKINSKDIVNAPAEVKAANLAGHNPFCAMDGTCGMDVEVLTIEDLKAELEAAE